MRTGFIIANWGSEVRMLRLSAASTDTNLLWSCGWKKQISCLIRKPEKLPTGAHSWNLWSEVNLANVSISCCKVRNIPSCWQISTASVNTLTMELSYSKQKPLLHTKSVNGRIPFRTNTCCKSSTTCPLPAIREPISLC